MKSTLRPIVTAFPKMVYEGFERLGLLRSKVSIRMPVLLNARHELFAQHLFKGLSAAAAFEMSGYARNYANAVRLKRNEQVQARLIEMQSEAAKEAIDELAFEAKALFTRLEEQIIEARRAGQLKVAGDLRMFMIRCFGYADSPTLTHNHIANREISPPPVPDGAEQPQGKVVPFSQERRFAGLIAKMRRRIAE